MRGYYFTKFAKAECGYWSVDTFTGESFWDDTKCDDSCAFWEVVWEPTGDGVNTFSCRIGTEWQCGVLEEIEVNNCEDEE